MTRPEEKLLAHAEIAKLKLLLGSTIIATAPT
ncbi:hypothetical protein CDHC01_0037 [Corynebacterium diphtheriae HC01]|nr:hypothetical protein CD31A_0039 [Corynebacterium diphtheriae 31A]AEX43104.1 hypothetical protein CD241_0037 [Corynebacterium diphtheriae 241]AEX47568.1 hypothetical protein CDBH8_0041 [Corynebacterium diphtheriae BH8]AEX73290.1 hypothetical protein CDHC01_0037 [Corynebacterium diphtheriae HC01]AEX75541.1 hypothetical protein CDHC02_0041 [Corynebacterium diphtheriae HC02]AEX82305.1 hypothetical protein CDVA01_0036 [Corynebacterium diphtheriae VA01]